MDYLGDDLTPILVTGASGYLGARVLGLLQASRIEAVGAALSKSEELLSCDLRDDAAVEKLMRKLRPATVMHCAALVPRTLADYSDITLAATNLRMVEALLRLRPQRTIFPSSMTVYPSDICFAREQDAMSTGPGYAAGKLDTESLLLQQSGIDVAILRLPGLFGPPRRSGVLFNAALAFARDEDFQLSEPVPQWSALHVDDAADLMIKALTLPRGKHLMNVGYPGRMSIPDAVGRLALLFDRNWYCSSSSSWFEFDLTRCHQQLGRVGCDFETRLKQLAEWARLIACES